MASGHHHPCGHAYRESLVKTSFAARPAIPFTGYFLGHALVRHMEEAHSLQEIARMPLDELKPYLLELLRPLATGDGP